MRPLPLPDPGQPPLTGPWTYLRWLSRRQIGVLLHATAVAIVDSVAGALQPFALGRIVDDGLHRGLTSGLWSGCLLLFALAMTQVGANIWAHRLEIENWLRASFASSQQIGYHVTRTGDAVTDVLPTGEVVTTVATDALRVGEIFSVLPQLIGGIVAYLTLSVLLLTISVPLGVLVLVGLPVVVAVQSLLIPPLQRRQAAQREASGRLTTLGTDTVSGLRILRGIGGEQVFSDRYRAQSQQVRRIGTTVAQTQSYLDALQTLLPGLFLALVVWAGARLAIAGQITPGQLVSFYGFAIFLTQPLWTASQAIRVFTRGLIGARKILIVLAVPVAGQDDPDCPATSPASTDDLIDERSGLTVRPGRLLAIVSADPDESAGIALRLGRHTPGRDLQPPDDDTAPTAVRWGSSLLRELRLSEVRSRIVVAESTPHLFAGTLTEEVDVRGRADRADLHAAIHAADAADLLDSIPGGLDGQIEEKGRSLSGGQRQRLALARALLTDAEVLILIEPTSAVDAHTESRIARRLADYRRGRTTVIVSASPLVLDVVDEVALVEHGRVTASGSHRSLLSTHPAYHRIVSRSDEKPTEEVTHHAATHS